MTSSTKRADRPSIDQYPTVEGRWNPVPAGSLTVEFFGTTSMLIRAGDTAVMIDGFFSRPPLEDLLGGPIAPSPLIIDGCLDRAGIDVLDAVVCVHSHYDHALDAPLIAARFDAPLLGSASTANIGRGYGLPGHLLRTVHDGETIGVKDLDLTFVESIHCPGDLMPGTISEPVVPPAPVSAWATGECYSLFVRHDSGTVLVHASANFIPGKLGTYHADAAYLGIGMLGKQDTRFRGDYWNQIVRATGARAIFPVHWDDFMIPLNDGPILPQPYAFDDVVPAMDFVFDQGRRDGLTVLLPTLWTPFAPFAGAAPHRSSAC